MDDLDSHSRQPIGSNAEVDRLIGTEIARRRTSIGLTAGEMAAVACLPEAAVVDFEMGAGRPSSEALFTVAKVLGVSTSQLFGSLDSRAATSIR